MTISDLRQAVIHLRQKLSSSERHTCRTIAITRSTQQYRAAEKGDDSLRLALIRLAKAYGRYGYSKIAELLRTEGWKINHKKVERLWREEGLQLPQRYRKRKRLCIIKTARLSGFVPYTLTTSPSQPCKHHLLGNGSIDFVCDRLSNGRSYKMLTVLDEYTREALCVTVKFRIGNAEVLEALYPLILTHGKPEFIRSDNGPEFVAWAFQTWLTKVGITPIRL